VNDYDIFVRSKPEHKLEIITALQSKGLKVGMVGDGVNDVLAMKTANLSIAMESGSRITQDVADLVLLNNDFSLMPVILFEGQNVVFNLRFINKVFLTKTFQAILFTIACALLNLIFPLLPTTILVYSFFSTSLPSYVIAFYRRAVKVTTSFWKDVLPPAILSALIATGVSVYTYLNYKDESFLTFDTAVMYSLFFYTTWYAIYELTRAKYLRKWYEVLVSTLFITVVGIGTSWFAFLRTYYDLEALTNTDWLQLFKIAGIGFLTYVVATLAGDVISKLRKQS
jgi:cation-transporting ATPase E